MVTAKKVPAKTAAKAPAKAPAKVAPVKRRTPKPKAEAVVVKQKPAEAAKTDAIGRITDLIKWVDSPFKLLTVILLSFLAFAGYFAWDSRQVILQAIQNQDHMPQLVKQDDLVDPAKSLMKDVDGLVVLVHKANLTTNSRTTVPAHDICNEYDAELFGL